MELNMKTAIRLLTALVLLTGGALHAAEVATGDGRGTQPEPSFPPTSSCAIVKATTFLVSTKDVDVNPWNPTITTPGKLGGTGGTSLEPSSSATAYVAAETNDTTLQAAIDAAADGGCVEVTMGNSSQDALVEAPWKPVNKAGVGVTVVVDPGVSILASRNPADYGGGSCGTISSTKDTSCGKHWIEPSGAKDIAIMGYGVLDGRCWDRSWDGSANGPATSGFCYNRVKTYCNHSNSNNKWAGITCTGSSADTTAYGPDMLHFKGSPNTVLYKITLKDCDNFCVYWGDNASGLTAWNIKIFAPGEVSNTDGFDPSYEATDISLIDSFISNGDNHIAIKSDSGSSYTGGETKNITIRNLQTASGIGVTIGYDTSGGVSNVLVDGLIQNGNQAVNPNQQVGHGINTSNGQGGNVSDVTFENTCVSNETTSLLYLANTGSYTGMTESNTTILKGSASGDSGELKFKGNSSKLGLALSNVNAGGTTTETVEDANLDLGPYSESSALETALKGDSGKNGASVANSVTGSSTAYPCTASTWQPLIGGLSLYSPVDHNAKTLDAESPATYKVHAYLHPAMDESTKESPVPTAPVQFYDNGKAVGGPAVLHANGTIATLSLSGLAAGTHVYTALYNVDGADKNYPTGFVIGAPAYVTIK
jgi:polygalacturonase